MKAETSGIQSTLVIDRLPFKTVILRKGTSDVYIHLHFIVENVSVHYINILSIEF